MRRPLVTAIDNAIPTQVIAALRAQILASSRRPATGDGTYWYSLAARPRGLFEQVIQHLRSHVPDAHELVGAEWWFRATATDTNFPFHFDRDEGIRSSIVSPAVATILYLSSAGGPTVIVDATPVRRSAPTAAIAVHPRPGRFGMFSGALLHGVVPTAPSRWPRVTMLVNWWRSVPRMEAAKPLASAPLRWPGARVTASSAPVEVIDPARLLAKAAWRELIATQASYR